MENLLLTGISTPGLDFIESLDRNLLLILFFIFFIVIVIVSCVAQVFSMMTQRSLSRDLYKAKIAQAEAEKFEAVVSKTASVKAVTEQEKDKALVALLQSFLRQTKLNPEQISQMMNEVKNDSRKSSQKATQEFLDEVVKNVNNDVDKVSVKDLEALLFGEDD